MLSEIKIFRLSKQPCKEGGGNNNAHQTHWETRLITSNGKELLGGENLHELGTLLTDEPTYYFTDLNEILDLIDISITRNISNISAHYIFVRKNGI